MKRMVLFALAASFAACSAPPSAPPAAELVAADSTPPTSTLTFAADWSVTQSAPVVGGGRATIHYDPARLPLCRSTYGSSPAWGITAWWSVDGGTVFSQPVTQLQVGKVVPQDITFDVDPGHDLAVWFSSSDVSGCQQWDSNYGNNFHFAIAESDPAVRFTWPGWEYSEIAPLHAGAEFIVDYDIRRLPYCRQDYNGLPTWDVTVGYRFDDGTTGTASLTTAPSQYERIQSFARVVAPAASSSVELWFENSDRTGCQRWDSAYGNNYRFALER